MSYDSYEFTVAPDGGLQDREAVVGAVIGHPLDATGKSFRDTIHAGIMPWVSNRMSHQEPFILDH